MKTSGEFLININQIPPEGRDFEFPVEPRWLDRQLEGCDVVSTGVAGRLVINVSPVGASYYVKGSVLAPCRLTCVRCLRDIELTLDIPLSLVLVKPGSADLLNAGEDEDVGVVRLGGDEIELDGEVREAILIELPMNPTCPQGCSLQDLYKD